MTKKSGWGNRLALAVAGSGLLLLHGWALLALYFWFSSHVLIGAAVAVIYAVLVLVIFRLAQTRSHAAWVSCVLVLAVAVWWTRREPAKDLLYPRETEQAAKFQVDGQWLNTDGIRDFRYRSLTDFDSRWSTRAYDMNELTNVDFFLSYGGVPPTAHIITSFVFKNQPPLAVSIERRAEKDEPGTRLRGLFRQHELFYLWADERDIIQLRTSILHVPVYLYRSSLTPGQGRQLLVAMSQRSNGLEENPEFYNTFADHWAGVIPRHVDEVLGRSVPWFRRPLLAERYEKLGYDEGWLVHSLPWVEHRAAALINDRANQGGSGADFSQRIRTHLPQPVVEQYPPQ